MFSFLLVFFFHLITSGKVCYASKHNVVFDVYQFYDFCDDQLFDQTGIMHLRGIRAIGRTENSVYPQVIFDPGYILSIQCHLLNAIE